LKHRLRFFFLTTLLFSVAGILFSQEAGISESVDTNVPEAAETENTVDDANKKIPLRKRFVFSVGISIFILKDEYDFLSAPMPVLPSPFFAVGFPDFGKTVKFRPEMSLELYRTHYKWSPEIECPVPAEIENRSATVWGFVLGVKGQGYYTYKRMTVRLSAGISADLRAVALAEDLNDADMEDATAQKDLIKDYVWQGTRWLFGEFGVGADYTVTEKCRAGLDVRMFLPFSRNDIAKTLPLGGYRFAVGVRVSL
jgi:hypothetical protein